MIERTVLNFLKKYNLLNSHHKILVAFSGGVDSVCLLYALKQLSLTQGFKLSAIHINHQWRGNESLEDEQFAINFCKELNIPIIIEKLDPELPKTELIARTERYKLFNTTAIKNNFNAIFTAHHSDDQVETILLRIIKGTGSHGLTGIPEQRLQEEASSIYRPLLNCNKNDIETYAKENSLKYRIDSSNFDEKYLRNKLRQTILPDLKEINPQIETALLNLSKINKNNERIINLFIKNIEQNIFIDPYTLSTESFLQLDNAIKPKILILLLEKNNLEYDFESIERLINDIETCEKSFAGKKFSITRNIFLHITKNIIKIVSPEPTTVIKSSAKVVIPGTTELKEFNIRLKVSEYNQTNTTTINFPPADADRAFVDLSQIDTDLTLRARQPGDIINPIGMKGHMKLKKYLINKHIPQNQKDSIPVITSGNEILWLVGMCLSNKIKVDKIPTHVLEIIRG